MKIWIHINNAQEGPYEFEELPLERITPDTPVWYEGLPDWQPAKAAPATAHLFEPKAEKQQAYDPWEPVLEKKEQQPVWESQSDWQQQRPQPQWQQQVQQPQRVSGQAIDAKCPPSYIVWSAVLGFLFMNPVALVSFILGFTVRRRFANGDLRGARSASRTSEWWMMITIVTCCMLMPLRLMLAI